MVDPALLSIEEVAKRLGVHFSTAYRLARKGVLPGMKIGEQWRFSEPMLQAWIEDGVTARWMKMESADEASKKARKRRGKT